MANVLNIIASVLDGVVAIPAVVVSIEIAAALLPERADAPRVAHRPPVAVLIPAHNERMLIGQTVLAVRADLRPDDRIIVVADNCTDDTAAVAANAGAEVIERHDLVRRGKGFALDFGVTHLKQSAPPAVVLIIDADVQPRLGSIDALASQVVRTGKPAQSVYLLKQSADAPANPVSLLAFRVRNLVRPLGLSRLAGPCPLFGAGMAFPWNIISTAPLASPHLTEDVALALDLAATGYAPRLCREALIEGESAPTDAASAKQRRRWEHGHMSLIFSHVPRTFLRGLFTLRPHAMMLAMDVMVPPLSLLVMLVTSVAGIMWIAFLIGLISITPAIVATVTVGMLLFAILAAWMRFAPGGDRRRQFIDMTRYAFGKVPMYVGFLFKRQKSWERTDRGSGKDGHSSSRRAA